MMKLFTRRACARFAGFAVMVLFGAVVQAQVQAQVDSQAAQPVTMTVLAAHPIVVSLAETLTEGTGIQVVRAAPANLPHTRWASYFDGRGTSALKRDAAKADAVLTLRSLWPDDPLYPLARRTNIRIVEVDAARPIDGALPGIALQAGKSDRNAAIAAQPWLSPSNLGRMADILANDLQRLVPDAHQPVSQNLAALKQRLVALTAQAEASLAAAPNVSVIMLSDRLDYLVTALNLDSVPFEQEGDEWEQASIDQLVDAVRDNDVVAVLHHGNLPEAAQSVVRVASPQVTVLAVEPAAQIGDVETAIEAVVQALRPASHK